MSRMNSVLDEFREFKNNPPRKGGLTAGLQGLRRKILVPIPMMKDYRKRFLFMAFCLQLSWSGTASAALMTGAFISLLSVFADNPGGMIRSLFNDPDVEVQLAEVSDINEEGIKLATRGRSMDAQEQEMWRAAQTGPYAGQSANPFAVRDMRRIIPTSSEELQIAIQTVTAQIWILLTKAVTAIATAAESENRRWQKYEQQRRANAEYRLSEGWRNNARDKIASDLCIRRFMVEILIDANKAPHPKARILELICDIGNYISESGMAGFFLTIKYGIETRYPALALNEFQADLSTVLSLMKAYTQMGERAPFMVILENSEQTKFSPGSYPLLWSYAMGVGATLDRAVNNLNYTKGFMEQQFYELGASMVAKMEGSVSRKMAEELGLTDDQIDQVKEVVQLTAGKSGKSGSQQTKMRSDAGSFKPNNANGIVNEDDEDDEEEDDYEDSGNRRNPFDSINDDKEAREWLENWAKRNFELGDKPKPQGKSQDQNQKLKDEVGGLLKNLGKKGQQQPRKPAPNQNDDIDDMSLLKEE
ncbi:nucleocapsid protein [Ninove microtus virus]|uniref:Nucleocapsid n=1 Tax=Ninove microtus virus TaxID=2940990 RepID=A0AAE9KYN5_9MONO|nr:nucleocapsid protein [Ninove microtus virus]